MIMKASAVPGPSIGCLAGILCSRYIHAETDRKLSRGQGLSSAFPAVLLCRICECRVSCTSVCEIDEPCSKLTIRGLCYVGSVLEAEGYCRLYARNSDHGSNRIQNCLQVSVGASACQVKDKLSKETKCQYVADT